jgi:hypothetical protein
MIAFVQPFGLGSPGGGPRILRAMLAGAPVPFVSIATSPGSPPATDLGKEIHLGIRPHFGRLEGTRLGRHLGALSLTLGSRLRDRLERVCRERRVSAIHAIPHGIEFWHGFEVAQRLAIPYILNVHDDMGYNLRGRPELKYAMDRLAWVWPRAQGRLVISDAMGEEYCRRYGERPYTVVTDGLEHVPLQPRVPTPGRLHVYFAGAIHRSYRANFECLLRGLTILQQRRPDTDVALICRGSSVAGRPGSVPVRSLPWGSEAEVDADLNAADLLYLPLPFEHEVFVRFSLSTKLVTYLGSGVPILFHGPAASAAGTLLAENRAAIPVDSPDPQALADAVLEREASMMEATRNALELGRRQFLLSEQRDRFWATLCREPDHRAALPSVTCRM